MSAIPTSRTTKSRRRIATPVTRAPRRGWHAEFETERDKIRFRPGIGNGGTAAEVVLSRRFTKRLEFGIGGKPFVDVSRAVARRQPEQAHRLVLRVEPQRQFTTVEIGFADLALLLGVLIGGGGEHGFRRHPAEERADDRRGPWGHVDFRARLR